MVFWTCHIFKISPRFDRYTKDVLLSGGKYIYDQANNKRFFLYNDSLQKSFGGLKIIKFCVDKPLWIFNREEGINLVKETVSIDACLYEEPVDISNFLAVFCSADNIKHFIRALEEVVSEKVRQSGEYPEVMRAHPLMPVRFRLKGRETELRRYFSNVRELSVRGIKDIYVHGARLRGFSLEESDEYRRYVRDEEISGEVNYFGMNFRDRVMMLSSEGKIWTRQGKKEIEPNIVAEILKILHKCDALIVRE